MPRDNGSPDWVFTELFVVLLADVTRLLADVDPVGLTHAGAPTDGYDVEAGQIVRRVIQKKTGSRRRAAHRGRSL